MTVGTFSMPNTSGQTQRIETFTIPSPTEALTTLPPTEAPTLPPTEAPTTLPPPEAPTLPPNQVEVTLIRTTKNWGYEESFKIYEGDNTNEANLKFVQPSVEAYQSYTWTISLSSTLHTIVMTDSYGDGWTNGSTLEIRANGMTVGTFSLNSGSQKIETCTSPSPTEAPAPPS